VNLVLPKIITGGSLESLFYAYATETPIVITQPYIPFELEAIEFHEMFKFLGYTTNQSLLKVQLWDRLVFVLSMAGLVMMPNNVRNVRHEQNSIVFALNDNSRFVIQYDQLISFDKHLAGKVMVYDWFDIRSGSKTELEELNDKKDNLVNKIIFYESRKKGQQGKGRKDLVALSNLKETTLLAYESSEGYARLKTLQMMKEAGMRGTPNGYNKKGLQLHYALKIEHTHREIIKRYKPKYTLDETFSKMTNEKEIWKLTQKLLHHKQISILQESSRLQVVV
jgi:flagellar basal body-associated protein FliL|tara:strand:+ start:637 stop:1476 length:840 start_codon:yes stop_codon:yes gene_type:complete